MPVLREDRTPRFEGAKVVWKDLNLYEGFTVEGNQAIASAIVNTIFTEKGERLFDPEFGCNIVDYLFEPIDEITAKAIKQEILD